MTAGFIGGSPNVVGRRQRPEDLVCKGMVVERKRTRPAKAVELGAGAAAVALGGPRLRMVGSALGRGIKNAGDDATRNRLIRIEAARRAWLTGTDPVVRKLPLSLQSPTVLAAGGTALAAHATPVRERSYRPVTGW